MPPRGTPAALRAHLVGAPDPLRIDEVGQADRRGGHGLGRYGRGPALGAVAAQAAQARLAVVQGDRRFEERRVRDADGNRSVKDVRVCGE